MFKLVPVAYDSSVCLRCQYYWSIRRATCQTKTQRATTTAQQLRGFIPGRISRQEQSLLSDDAQHEEPVIPHVRKVVPGSFHRLEDLFVPKTSLGGGRHVHPRSKNALGFNALGEPAEVLVLADRGMRHVEDSPVIEIRSERADKAPVAEALSSSDMLDEIDAERGLVDPNQVIENIENVKAEWMERTKTKPNVLTATEYTQLSSQLLHGFTVTQLALYLGRADADKLKDPLDLRNQFSSSLYTRSAWTPAATPIKQTRAPKLVELERNEGLREQSLYRSPARQLSHKPTLVERILRHCWRLEVRQDEALEGELQIRLHAKHFSIVVNHSKVSCTL